MAVHLIFEFLGDLLSMMHFVVLNVRRPGTYYSWTWLRIGKLTQRRHLIQSSSTLVQPSLCDCWIKQRTFCWSKFIEPFLFFFYNNCQISLSNFFSIRVQTDERLNLLALCSCFGDDSDSELVVRQEADQSEALERKIEDLSTLRFDLQIDGERELLLRLKLPEQK